MDEGDAYDLDEIAERSGVDRVKLLPRLLELELAGAVRRVEGGRFVPSFGRTVLRYSKGSHGKIARHRRITGEGKDNQQVSRTRLQSARVDGTRPRSAEEQARRRRRRRLRAGLRADGAARKKVIAELKSAAKDATDIYIATDPDREGEAIGWHLAEELGTKKKKIHRLMFNEITKKAVQEAMKHPGAIDMKMVDAQQARRVLDRLVGYKISPILWDKVRRGLSAGRVQSVALKLICDREQEIAKFVPGGVLAPVRVARRSAAARVRSQARQAARRDHQDRQRSSSRRTCCAISKAPTFVVSSVATKERKRNAAPPFITSKLQQTARYPVKRTMQIAQQLYEGIELPGPGRRRARSASLLICVPIRPASRTMR